VGKALEVKKEAQERKGKVITTLTYYGGERKATARKREKRALRHVFGANGEDTCQSHGYGVGTKGGGS